MANYAVVKNGVVENIVLWDGVSEFSVPDTELIKATVDARIGGSWDGNVFTFVEPDPGPDTRPYDEKRKAEYPSINSLDSKDSPLVSYPFLDCMDDNSTRRYAS